MIIKLCTTNNKYLTLLKRVFQHSLTSLIAILNKDILSVSADALILPTNSFGFLDKNINDSYKYFFGYDIGTIIQDEIKSLGHELLIGESIVISVDNPRIHNIIVSPTIRSTYKIYTIPNPLADILVTDNIYFATRSSIITAIKYNIKSVSLPIMNITNSRVSEELVCKAMLLGIQDAMFPYTFPKSISETYLIDRDVDKLLSYTGD